MSRAFVNEDQAAAQADQPVERRVSDQPNYLTASGLRQLQQRVAELNALRSELQARVRVRTSSAWRIPSAICATSALGCRARRWCLPPTRRTRCRLVAG